MAEFKCLFSSFASCRAMRCVDSELGSFVGARGDEQHVGNGVMWPSGVAIAFGGPGRCERRSRAGHMGDAR